MVGAFKDLCSEQANKEIEKLITQNGISKVALTVPFVLWNIIHFEVAWSETTVSRLHQALKRPVEEFDDNK